MVENTVAKLAAMRREYSNLPLVESGLAPDWPTQFATWLDAAYRSGLDEPNAMVLATATHHGSPSARSVLLKAYDATGLVFFTNYDSRKGRELAENPYVSLVFPWYALHRQVVICGTVQRLPRARTEQYFASRPRGAQLAAWASRQSEVLAERAELEAAWQEAGQRWPENIPTPDNWGGFTVVPDTVEFWQGRPNRLHDRLQFRRTAEGWIIERLAP